jgi:uncharacterized protein RhaS with RHS repeats
LYYLQARYYDPETARFLSRDPVIGTEDLPLTQNPYIYAVDNPVMMTDPDGQHPLVVAVIVVGGRQVVIYYAKKQIKKKAYKLVRKQVAKKVTKGIDSNKLKHIFGKPQHKLDGFLKKYGGDQIKAYRALYSATQKHIKSKGIKGKFEEVVNVNGSKITVRGNVVNGEVKIGTAFIR